MRFVADLYIHSRFSRATSPKLSVERLAEWAQLKGITLVGTGDFAHPGWFGELCQKLVEAEQGLFRLDDDLADTVAERVSSACRPTVRYMLSVEFSSIDKKGGRTRKVYNVVFVPGLSGAERLIERLPRIGNLRSDGPYSASTAATCANWYWSWAAALLRWHDPCQTPTDPLLGQAAPPLSGHSNDCGSWLSCHSCWLRRQGLQGKEGGTAKPGDRGCSNDPD